MAVVETIRVVLTSVLIVVLLEVPNLMTLRVVRSDSLSRN